MMQYNCGSSFGYCKNLFIIVFLCTLLSGAADVCTAACGAFDARKKEGMQSQVRKKIQNATIRKIADEERFEQFDDFIVRLRYNNKIVCRDAKNADVNGRVLLCTVIVQMNEGMELPKDKLQLRKVIYGALKKPLDSVDIRETIREEIKLKLNTFVGEGKVHGVYFAKFILL